MKLLELAEAYADASAELRAADKVLARARAAMAAAEKIYNDKASAKVTALSRLLEAIDADGVPKPEPVERALA